MGAGAVIGLHINNLSVLSSCCLLVGCQKYDDGYCHVVNTSSGEFGHVLESAYNTVQFQIYTRVLREQPNVQQLIDIVSADGQIQQRLDL